jgi:hypothetical protein
VVAAQTAIVVFIMLGLELLVRDLLAEDQLLEMAVALVVAALGQLALIPPQQLVQTAAPVQHLQLQALP